MASTLAEVTQVEKGEGEAVIGRALKKTFDGVEFDGVVTSFDAKDLWYKVKYTDGDREELEWNELKELLLPAGTPVKVSVEDAEASAAHSKKEKAARTPTTGGKRKQTAEQEDELQTRKSPRSTGNKKTKTPGKDDTKSPAKKEPRTPASNKKSQAQTPASEKGKKKQKGLTEEEKDEEELAKLERELKSNNSRKGKLQAELELLAGTIQKQETEKAALIKRRDNREAEWLARQAKLMDRKAAHTAKKEEVLKEIRGLLEVVAAGGRVASITADQINNDNFWDKAIGPKVGSRVKSLNEEWQHKEKILEDAKQAANRNKKLLKDLGLVPTPVDLAAEKAEQARFEAARRSVSAAKEALLKQVADFQRQEAQAKDLWHTFCHEGKALVKEEEEVEESKPKKLRNQGSTLDSGSRPSGQVPAGSSIEIVEVEGLAADL